MPRSRGSAEVHQRGSPRVPLHLKATVCSEANGVARHSTDRSSPKVSPRSPLHEKKRGTRVADLETKLTQTQEEIKKLKEQLTSAEAAKRDAQQELEETKKLINPIPPKEEVNPIPREEKEEEEVDTQEESIYSPATDVFEVVAPTESFQTEEAESSREEVETKAMIEEVEDDEQPRQPKSNADDMSELSVKMAKIEMEINTIATENENLKKQVEEASAASKAKEEEMSAKLVNLEEELKESKIKGRMLEEKLEEVEGAKEVLELEMKRLRVQTEQWRKAAEVAAAVLATGEDGTGRKVGGRCGSMEKHIGGYGGVGFLGSSGIRGSRELEEDGLGGGGKRRGGGGMKMFGELWKKKGQK